MRPPNNGGVEAHPRPLHSQLANRRCIGELSAQGLIGSSVPNERHGFGSRGLDERAVQGSERQASSDREFQVSGIVNGQSCTSLNAQATTIEASTTKVVNTCAPRG